MNRFRIAFLATLACTIVAIAATSSSKTCSAGASGRWQEVGQLPIPLESHAMVVMGDRIYIIGGWNESGGAHADVFFAPLANGRIAGDWQQTAAALPLQLQHHQAIARNGALYVLGGDNGFGPNGRVSDRIFRAIPDANGDIHTWEEIGRLPEPRTIHAVTVAGDRLYVLGGSKTFQADTVLEDTAWVAPIKPDGRLGEFVSLPPLPRPVGWLTATTVRQQIVAIAGRTSFQPWELSGEIWQATLTESTTGTLDFTEVGTTISRERHATVQLGNALAIVGGGTKQEPLTTVTVTTLTPEGTLTPWVTLEPLPQQRYAHAALAHAGNIIVSGGFLRYGSNETSRQVFSLTVCQDVLSQP